MVRCDAGSSCDQAGAIEIENHLVDGWRGDPKVPLHVGFGGGTAEDAAVGMDEGQILALLECEGGSRRRHAPNN